MNTNNPDKKSGKVPSTITFGELAPRIEKVAARFSQRTTDIIRLAVRLRLEQIEATGTYDIPEVKPAPGESTDAEDANQAGKEELAKRKRGSNRADRK